MLAKGQRQGRICSISASHAGSTEAQTKTQCGWQKSNSGCRTASVGAKEGRSCKGATCQHHEDRPEKRGYQKGGQEAGLDDWTGCGVTCQLRESDGVRPLSSTPAHRSEEHT